MSLKNKFFSIIAVVAGIAAFSTVSFAQDSPAAAPVPNKVEKHWKGEGRKAGKAKHHGRGFGGRHHGPRGFHGLRGLDLTDTQKEQIRVIRENNKPDAAVKEEMQAIREAKRAGKEITPEQKERLKVLREQFRAKGKMVHEQIMAILTVEQKAQLEQRKQEMKQRRQEFKERRQQSPAATEPKIS